MPSLELGIKIRKYRKDLGLSIQALALQANITPSMLSQIERGLANPSINTLQLIASALNVPLFQLFTHDDSQNEEYVVRKNSRKRLLESSDGSSSEYEMLTPNTNGNIEFMLQRFLPGSNSGDAIQTHNAEEVAYVVRGKISLVVNQCEIDLEPGDSARIPIMAPHCWYNHSDQEAVLIYALTPPCF